MLPRVAFTLDLGGPLLTGTEFLTVVRCTFLTTLSNRRVRSPVTVVPKCGGDCAISGRGMIRCVTHTIPDHAPPNMFPDDANLLMWQRIIGRGCVNSWVGLIENVDSEGGGFGVEATSTGSNLGFYSHVIWRLELRGNE